MNGPLRKIHRKGASAVEFAVVLPIIVLLLLGSVEFGRSLMVQHSLQEAAQAGCRIYTVKDATQQQARDIIDTAMANAKINDYTIEFSPLTKAEVDEHMEGVSVKVTAEYNDIAWVTGWFMPGATIAGNCTMPAEMETTEMETTEMETTEMETTEMETTAAITMTTTKPTRLPCRRDGLTASNQFHCNT